MVEILSNFHEDVPISIELVKLEFPHAVNKLPHNLHLNTV